MDPDFNQRKRIFLLHFGPQLEAHRPGCTTGRPIGFPLWTILLRFIRWIQLAEGDFIACAIPPEKWVYGGMLYLPEELSRRMSVKGGEVWKENKRTWSWGQFRIALQNVFDFYYGRHRRFSRAFRQDLELNRTYCTFGRPRDLPQLNKSSFYAVWIPEMEADFLLSQIPRIWWARAGMLYLPDGVKCTMTEASERHWKETGYEWTWDDFRREVQDDLDAADLGPKILKGIACAALGIVIGPPVIVAGLGALGFGAAGVAAGSAAAGIQSILYGGATTGLFSICQAIGATGAVGPAGVAISGAAGAAVAKVLPSNRR